MGRWGLSGAGGGMGWDGEMWGANGDRGWGAACGVGLEELWAVSRAWGGMRGVWGGMGLGEWDRGIVGWN